MYEWFKFHINWTFDVKTHSLTFSFYTWDGLKRAETVWKGKKRTHNTHENKNNNFKWVSFTKYQTNRERDREMRRLSSISFTICIRNTTMYNTKRIRIVFKQFNTSTARLKNSKQNIKSETKSDFKNVINC